MTKATTRRQLLRGLAAAGVGAGTSALAGCSAPTSDDSETPANGGGNGGGGTETVEMTDELTFAPEAIEIPAGTTVVWENVGSIGHTVTAYEDKIPQGADYFASGGFDSEQAARDGYPKQGNVQAGETFEHTFETAGEYGYFCIPHELNGMVGTVTVT
ncbi:MAG: plastocyanin/azurin family copper-binding protein [Halobacteriales archaeon]